MANAFQLCLITRLHCHSSPYAAPHREASARLKKPAVLEKSSSQLLHSSSTIAPHQSVLVACFVAVAGNCLAYQLHAFSYPQCLLDSLCLYCKEGALGHMCGHWPSKTFLTAFLTDANKSQKRWAATGTHTSSPIRRFYHYPLELPRPSVIPSAPTISRLAIRHML